MLADEWELGRIRRDGRDRRGEAPRAAGTPAFVGQVLTQSANLAVGKFFLAQPTGVLGNEAEGGAATYSPGRGSVPVLLLGPALPSTGDFLVCRFVKHRWVAERSGHPGGPSNLILLPSCACPVPSSLRMTSASTTCNYGMFQDATLQWQAPPACFAPLNIISNIFMSTTTFIDVFGNVPFYYYLYCQYNQFFLTRIYCTSPYGSPYRDAALYSWAVGGYGNNCSPFRLDNGTPFPGSDASCFVTIDPA